MNVDPLLRGVPLEVALERPLLERSRERVLGPGEVIHADVNVASVFERVDERREHIEALWRVRQRVALEQFLRGVEPGHVRVAIDREAIW